MFNKLKDKLHNTGSSTPATGAGATNTTAESENTLYMAGVGASLRGRLVLITGCTGGIGQATAKAFARVGCSIAVHYNAQSSAAKAETLIAELKTLAPSDAQPKFAAFQANLSRYDDARRLYGEVVQTLGNPDVLFSNHGMAGPTIGPNGDIRDISPEVFEETWRTNTGTHFLLTQLCVPYMEEQKWGRVIYTSSVAAGNGGVIGPHYASSKSALHGLVRWMSLRYAKSGITTNALAPALIEGRRHPPPPPAPPSTLTSSSSNPETNMMSNPTPEARSKIPIGRLGKPNEMADIVLLLASNGYMTNKIIVADGGWTIGNF